MYLPPQFDVADLTWAIELIDRHPFGFLATGDAEYPRISHLPMIADEREDGLWIVGHVARANPHVSAIFAQSPATVAFQGPHAYVSASWYEAPYSTVPTWNYAAVHVCGRLRETDACRAVELLSEKLEGSKVDAWDPRRLDAGYRSDQLRGIVAFELRAEAVYAKAKLSQNRTDADRMRVMQRLSVSDDQTDRECAAAMALFMVTPPEAARPQRRDRAP
jgi:transcriptional regulator